MVKGKPNLVPPVWVINLKESTDRHSYMTGHLSKLGIAFTFLDAINGQRLTEDELSAHYDSQRALQLMPRGLSVEEIGCALSHLKLYQKMLDEGVEEVIIMEDDVQIQPSFLELFRCKDRFPKDWELIKLGHWPRHHTSYLNRKQIFKHYKIVKFVIRTYGNQCYLVKRSAAAKLLLAGYPVIMPADHLVSGKIRAGVNLYGIDPPCVQHLRDSGEFTTTLHGREEMKSRYFGHMNDNPGLLERIRINVQELLGKKIVDNYKRIHPKYII